MFALHEPHIRAVLRQHPEGLTTRQIMEHLPRIKKSQTLRNILERRMPDAYIDRWAAPVRGQYQAVWCVVTPPRHCPYPTERYAPETRWVGERAAA